MQPHPSSTHSKKKNSVMIIGLMRKKGLRKKIPPGIKTRDIWDCITTAPQCTW